VKVLVIDIGGSHVKLLSSGRRTPREMVRGVKAATEDWNYDAVSIGYPGPVVQSHPTREPVNLGEGWVRYNYERAFGMPVRIINDAAMQALGSYEGGRMLFLGLGTGLGNTLVLDGTVIPLELAHLPYLDGTYEEYLGEAGMKRLGQRKWRRHLEDIIELFMEALIADYTVLGGGNVRFVDVLPPNTRRGSNLNAFRGGFRLWKKGVSLT
jgi:predicted NBD/HSP70 family sugar kinase